MFVYTYILYINKLSYIDPGIANTYMIHTSCLICNKAYQNIASRHFRQGSKASSNTYVQDHDTLAYKCIQTCTGVRIIHTQQDARNCTNR